MRSRPISSRSAVKIDPVRPSISTERSSAAKDRSGRSQRERACRRIPRRASASESKSAANSGNLTGWSRRATQRSASWHGRSRIKAVVMRRRHAAANAHDKARETAARRVLKFAAVNYSCDAGLLVMEWGLQGSGACARSVCAREEFLRRDCPKKFGLSKNAVGEREKNCHTLSCTRVAKTGCPPWRQCRLIPPRVPIFFVRCVFCFVFIAFCIPLPVSSVFRRRGQQSV